MQIARPPVDYARDVDVRIAYQVIGKGPPDVVLLPGFVSHLDLAWEEPHLARFLRSLAQFCRVIWFDKRGTGLSDPLDIDPGTDQRVADIATVMDAASSGRAHLFGISEGASLSALFAARNPERVHSLILYAGFARLVQGGGYPYGWTEEFFEFFLSSFDLSWRTGEGIELSHPSVAGDERFREWWTRYLRAAASPRTAQEVMRANAAIDLRPVLSEISVPTLVLHRAEEVWVGIENSRYLAEHIEGATLITLPGRDHWPWIGDPDPVLRELEVFVTGRRRRRDERPRWGPESLTPREREVVRLATEGLSAKQIAEQLVISERTAESHLEHIYTKLDVGSRVELIRRATELAL